jgi:hypothetical protein
MKLKLTTVAAIALICPAVAHAAIEAKVVYITSETNNPANGRTYTVPSNKVFVIENIITSERDENLVITNTNVRIFFGLKRNETFEEIINLQPSLKIPGGWTLTIENSADVKIALFGLLVDAEDLYAGIGNSVGGLARTGSGTLQTTVGLDAGRQAIVKLQESLDLATWAERTDVASALGTSHAEHVITVPINTSVEEAFQRAMIRSRRGSSGMPH